jgi:hypothetical protein
MGTENETRVFFRPELHQARWERMLREARDGRPQFYASLGPFGRIASYWMPKQRAVAVLDGERGFSRPLYTEEVPAPIRSRAAAAGVSIHDEYRLELGMIPNRWVRFQSPRAHGDGGKVISFSRDPESGDWKRKRLAAESWEGRRSVLSVSVELARAVARRRAAKHVESLALDQRSPAASDAFMERFIAILQEQMREEQQGWDEPSRAVDWLRSLVSVDRTIPVVLHLTHVEHADESVVEFVRLAWEAAQREGLPVVLEIGDESANSEVGKRMVDEVRGVTSDAATLHVLVYGSAADARFPLSWTSPGLPTRHAAVGEAFLRAFAPDSGEGCAFVCRWLELTESLEHQAWRSAAGSVAPHRVIGTLDNALERCRVGAGDRALLLEAFARAVAEWIDRSYDPYGCEAHFSPGEGLGRAMIVLPAATQVMLLGWARDQYPLPATPDYSERPAALALRALDLGLACAGSQRAWRDAHAVVRDLRRVDWTAVPDALVSGQHRVAMARWAFHVGDFGCGRRLMQHDAARWRQALVLDPSNQPATYADPRSVGAVRSRRGFDHRRVASGFALTMFSTMIRVQASVEDGIDPVEAGVIPAEQIDAWRDLSAGEQVVGSFAWCEDVMRSMGQEFDDEEDPPSFAADGTVKVDDENPATEADDAEQQDWSLASGPLKSPHTPRSNLAHALDRIADADEVLGEYGRALQSVREAVQLRTQLAVTEDADWERVDLERSTIMQAHLAWRVEREFGRPTEPAYAEFAALAEKIGKPCFDRLERGGNPFFLEEFVSLLETYAEIARQENRRDDELEALAGASFTLRLIAAIAGPRHARKPGMRIMRRLAVRRFHAGFRSEARRLISTAIEWSAEVERSGASLPAAVNRLLAELDFVDFERAVGLTEPAHARLERIAPEARSVFLPCGTEIALLGFGRVMERVAEANAADGDLGVALVHIDEIVRMLAPDAAGIRARPRSYRLLLQRVLRLGAEYARKLRREEAARRYSAQADAVPTAMAETHEVEWKPDSASAPQATVPAQSGVDCTATGVD